MQDKGENIIFYMCILLEILGIFALHIAKLSLKNCEYMASFFLIHC